MTDVPKLLEFQIIGGTDTFWGIFCRQFSRLKSVFILELFGAITLRECARARHEFD